MDKGEHKNKDIRRLRLGIIEPRDSQKKVVRSFRLHKKVDDTLNRITEETGETKTYVLESLLEFAIKAYEKEGKKLGNSQK